MECGLYTFGAQWVMPARVIQLDCCRGQMGSHSILDIWRIAPLCLMWSIWRERNTRCFEDRDRTKEELKNILVKSLFNWTGPYNISHTSNFSKFVEFCSSFSI
jgi:hypothetical protein